MNDLPVIKVMKREAVSWVHYKILTKPPFYKQAYNLLFFFYLTGMLQREIANNMVASNYNNILKLMLIEMKAQLNVFTGLNFPFQF